MHLCVNQWVSEALEGSRKRQHWRDERVQDEKKEKNREREFNVDLMLPCRGQM